MTDTHPLLTFARRAPLPGLRTHDVDVFIARTNKQIGTIRWYRDYRQYVFAPEAGSVYSASVLTELRQHLKSMMKAWKRRADKTPFVKGDFAQRNAHLTD